ncbi:MAG: 16S rRNA (cytosine(967)-C(5))-methyltransferase RsmB [Christensenellales bacterium]
MNTAERNLIAARLLMKVYGGAYSSIELNRTLSQLSDERDRAYVSRMFYGVLSKNTQLDYILGRLTERKPKLAAAVVIKMGIYMLRFMDAPDYAVLNTQVELIKRLGKKELSGFVNAVLRRSADVILPISAKDAVFEISVNYSCPEWIVDRLISQYGEAFTRDFLSSRLPEKTHVRVNEDKINKENFIALTGGDGSPCGVYSDYAALKKLPANYYAVQSLSSVLAAEYYSAGLKKGDKTLDLCAAPGGKAVYLAQLGADVTACDIHPHRVKLIESYAKRMGVKLKAEVSDALKYRSDFSEKFNCVVCDVPCSGIGVMFSKPDVIINRKEGDVGALSALQYSILTTAAAYVADGGQLNYSTCTVFKEENEDIINRFLNENSNFTLEKAACAHVSADGDGFVRLFPKTHNCDGFFVAKLRRVK